jgi:ABC-2 type transport system ATP-binding protein
VGSGAQAVLELAGLTKRFGSGLVAVDRLDLRVGEGEVWGLLGPNGAGKTTTLRMLLGLVSPTAGSMHLFGDPLRFGHPSLARVGALVEGAEFVPHLSGLKNLRLWWEAGGGRWADADLEGALGIAGLGAAVHRKVKTYSHGMRQRLGVARALLGRPDLLLLDEPTSGLDPGEMRVVRGLLQNLASRGSSILLSSHLLSEVELVCSHVAVMGRGRLVAEGRVDELLASSGSVYLEVDDAASARRVLGELRGIGAVDDEGPGLAVRLDGLARREMVAALVAAGVGVDTVAPRHRLEDQFLRILGDTIDDQEEAS